MPIPFSDPENITMGRLTLIFLLFLSLCVGSARAQEQTRVRVVLKSGKELVAPLVEVKEDTIVLRTPDGLLHIEKVNLADLEKLSATATTAPVKPQREIAQPAPVPVAETDPNREPEVGEPGWVAPGAETAVDDSKSVDAPVDEAPPPTVATTAVTPESPLPVPSSAEDRTDDRVGRLVQRYLWFVPETSGNRFSVGGIFLFVLLMVVRLSARMANLEQQSMGRDLGMAMVAFVLLAAQFTFVPMQVEWIAGVAFAAILVWFAASQVIYGAGVYGSTVMFVCFVLSVLLGVLCLETVGFVLAEADVVTTS